jgi:hypothetical protein
VRSAIVCAPFSEALQARAHSLAARATLRCSADSAVVLAQVAAVQTRVREQLSALAQQSAQGMGAPLGAAAAARFGAAHLSANSLKARALPCLDCGRIASRLRSPALRLPAPHSTKRRRCTWRRAT